MKNVFYIIYFALLLSCSTQKNITTPNTTSNSNSITTTLTDIERSIINTFIDIEIKKERYIRYKDYEIVIVEEALKKTQAIDSYSFSSNEWTFTHNTDKKRDTKNWYPLNSLEVKKIKKELAQEKTYHWKTTDFENIKVSLLKYEELIKSIRKSDYLKNKIIIYLSRPLIIDKKNALVSFEVGNGDLGFSGINHFTVLMRKVKNNWEQSYHYYDGVFH